jgi:hypothetical protein
MYYIQRENCVWSYSVVELLCNIVIAEKFLTIMASVQEMLVEDIKEEIEEKIDIQNDFPNLTAISSSDEEHMPK